MDEIRLVVLARVLPAVTVPRRSNHDASVPCRAQLPLNAVAARSGLVAKPQSTSATRQLCHQRLQGSRSIRDLAMLAHVTPNAGLGENHHNRVLVHIQTNLRDRLFHDPSPMHEARHRQSGAILDILRTVRRVAPISGEHLV